MKADDKRSVAPAEGERRAIRNLKAQYSVAARLVRDALLDGDLEWVRLVDPEAGRLSTLSRIDPATALHQNDWLLGGRGAQRSDTMSGIAIGQLGSDDPDIVADTLIMIARLILPFHLHTSSRLSKAVLAIAAGPLATHPRVASALTTMRTVVSAKVQDRSLFEELFGVTPGNPSTRSEPDGSLTASDGRVFGQTEIEALAASPSALAAMLKGATQRRPFPPRRRTTGTDGSGRSGYLKQSIGNAPNYGRSARP